MTINVTMVNGSKMTYTVNGDRKYAVKIAREFASYAWTRAVEFDGVKYKG